MKVVTLMAGALLALATGPTQAQQVPAGRLLASNCFQCHGTNGKGPGFETLTGKSASDIYKELLEMKRKTTEIDIMKAHSKGYTDQQLWAIAQYLSTQR
jgi:cytochrome c553